MSRSIHVQIAVFYRADFLCGNTWQVFRLCVHISDFQDGFVFLIDTAGNITHNMMGERKEMKALDAIPFWRGLDVRKACAASYCAL